MLFLASQEYKFEVVFCLVIFAFLKSFLVFRRKAVIMVSGQKLFIILAIVLSAIFYVSARRKIYHSVVLVYVVHM